MKGGDDMKRTIFLGCIILLSALMVLTSCATTPTAIKKTISGSDLQTLKGQWEGMRSTGGGKSERTELEIYNDSTPLKGKLMAHNVIIRGERGRTVTIDFNNGVINSEGNLMIKSEQNIIDLSLYPAEGKPRLEGSYYLMGGKGTLRLNKK